MTSKITKVLGQDEMVQLKQDAGDDCDFPSLQDKLSKAISKVLSAPKYKNAILIVSEKLPEGLQDIPHLEKRAFHILALGDIEVSDIPTVLAAAMKAKMD